MVTPAKLGESYRLQNLTGNILYGNIAQTKPSTGETIGSIFGGIAGIGLGILGSVMTAKQTQNTTSTTPNASDNQTQQPSTQDKITQFQQKISEIQLEIDGLDNTLSQLGETDPKALEADKKELDAKQAELFNKETEKGKLANEIMSKQETVSAMTQKYNSAQLNFNNANNTLQGLESNLANANAVLKQNPNDTNAQQVKADAEAQIPQAKQEKANAEAAMKEAETLKNNAEKELADLKAKQPQLYNEIATDVETYNKQKQEYEMNNSAIQTNIELKSKTASKRAELVAQKAFYEGQVKSLQAQLVKQQGEVITRKTSLGGQYTEADKNDGNWWKRNMPSWLGGASKTERKEMKEAHKQKNGIVDAMEDLGGSKSDLKAMQNQNVSQQTDAFLSGRLTNSDIREAVSDAIKNGSDPTAAYNKEVNQLISDKTDSFIDNAINKVKKSNETPERKKALINHYNSQRETIEGIYRQNIGASEMQILSIINGTA